jgi:hypothetical protein
VALLDATESIDSAHFHNSHGYKQIDLFTQGGQCGSTDLVAVENIYFCTLDQIST